jgi:hypothetical protein
MRFYRFTFVAGLAVGFVAGTRAGRERYDQMVKFARTTAENPTVQQAAGALQAQATSLFSAAAKKVGSGLQDAPHLAQSAAQSVGEHVTALRHRNGHRNGHGNAASNGGSGAGRRPFAATSSSDLGRPPGQQP